MTDPEIETRRLRLSRLLTTDAPALFGYRSHPDVCRYQGFEPGSLEEAREFIRALERNIFGSPGSWFQFGLRLREQGSLIGDLGVHFPADEPRQAELGFTLAPSHQAHGYATEAVEGVLGYLFSTRKLHRVFASADPRNGQCIALLRRVGMRQEAHFRQSLWLRGGWVDDVVFGILASEWRDARTMRG